MESERFDELIRGAFTGPTRRGVMRAGASAIAATGLAMFGRAASEVDAKKKKKKKKKKRCPSNRPVKCGNGCCPSNFSQCCDNASEPTNSFTCNPSDFTCCSLENGGGSCDPLAPKCCPPSLQAPFGTCEEEEGACCTTDEGGGSCPADFPVCCLFDPEDPFSGTCCEEGVSCCQSDGDCEGTDICDFGCCISEVLATSESTGRRGNRRSQRGGAERFHKKAK